MSASTTSSKTHVHLPETDWSFWRHVVLRAPGFPATGIDALTSPGLASMADLLPAKEADGTEEWGQYRKAFDAETGRLSSCILRLATDERLALALAWQNHLIFDTAIAPMLRHEAGTHIKRNSKQRQHEELIVSYWQRYCVKNDSIGFTGPVGWSVLDPAAQTTRLEVGRKLVASSEVFFETWAIDQLAATIATQPGIAPWTAPRKLPLVRLAGHHAITAGGVPHELSPVEFAVLQQCTGQMPAYEIAREIAGLTPGSAAPEDVYAAIARLRDKRLLAWKLQLPISPYPERHLRRFLERVGDKALAGDALQRLDQLEAARGAAWDAASHGSPAGFVSALHDLDETFTTVTGAQPTRRSGQTYGGRTIIYHDARRAASLTLGADFFAALEPLGMILDSARWLTYHFGAGIQGILSSVATRLSANDSLSDLASFWLECMPVIYRSAPSIMSELQRDFQLRWAEILQISPGTREVRRTADELRERVREAFEAPHSGWSAGRYCSPDLMIAASGVDAIERGDFELVLGEMHLTIPTSRHYCFVTQHPSPGELLDCLTADSPEPRLLPVVPKESKGRLTIRTQSALTRDIDFLVAFGVQTADPSRPRLLNAADLRVTYAPGRPVAVTIPGGSAFPVIDVFSEMLVRIFIDAFQIMSSIPYQPRVVIDQFVIARETWRFDIHSIDFPQLRDEASRFEGCRRWLRTAGLPNQVFVKVPGETKPFLVDFSSIISVNILAKSLRRLQALAPTDQNTWVQFAEMLPSPDQLWLTDAEGSRYTSELRFVAVDQRSIDGTGSTWVTGDNVTTST